MNNVALYIGADPFTFNDLDLVKKTIATFGFVNIFLDRKNRDPEHKTYFLNYTDRADIIKHDLKVENIDNYKIVPIDETVEKAMSENQISTLLLNFDYQYNTNFRMLKVLQYVNPNLNIMLVRGQGYIEPHFIKTLLDSDSSLQIYKKFCSEYAFTKLKIKTMKKIGLTGRIGSNFDSCLEAFKEHGYSVIDVEDFIRNIQTDEKAIACLKARLSDKGIQTTVANKEDIIELCTKSKDAYDVFQKFIYSKINCMLGQKLKEMFSDKVVIVFAMLCEFGMEGMMNKTICLKCDQSTTTTRLIQKAYPLDYIQNLNQIQMGIEEKCEYCDFIIDDDENTVSNIVKLLNTKLKRD